MQMNYFKENKYITVVIIVIIALLAIVAGLWGAGVFESSKEDTIHPSPLRDVDGDEMNTATTTVSSTSHGTSTTSPGSPSTPTGTSSSTQPIFPGATQGNTGANPGLSSAVPVTSQGTPTRATTTPTSSGVSSAQPVTNQGTPTIAPTQPSSASTTASGTMVIRPTSGGPTMTQPTQPNYPSISPGQVQPRPVYEIAYFEHITLPSNFYCNSNPCTFSFNSTGEYRVDGRLKTTLSPEKLRALQTAIDQANYADMRSRNAPQTSTLNPAYGCSQHSGKVVYTFKLTNGQTEVIDACQHKIFASEEPFNTIEYLRSVFP